MQASREVDWVAAWYDIWGVADATLNFWITATFAVLVAVHALGNRATKQITLPIAILYTGFSLYTAFRVVGILRETQKVVEEITKPDINLFAHYTGIGWGTLADYVLFGTFVFGCIYTVYFVITAPNRIDT